MGYSYLKPRLAKLIPELANNETALRLALPAAIGGATGLGALAYNAVAPLDVDPIGLAVGTGLALGTQGRTPYNYAGIGALGLEGARYLNNAFTNSSDTESSPLIAMGIGAGALGLREALRRGVLTYPEAGFPAVGRMAKDLGESNTTTPITVKDVVAPPPKPTPNPSRPTPKPRVEERPEYTYKQGQPYVPTWQREAYEKRIATESTVAPVNPTTGNVSVVIPTAKDEGEGIDILLSGVKKFRQEQEQEFERMKAQYAINDYIAKSPLLDKERAAKYADPTHPDYQPDFVKMISQERLGDDFRAKLAFPEDVLAETFRGTGVPSPVVTGATHLPILMGSFDGERYRGKLNSDVLVIRGSSLSGGEGKSDLVNRGVVPEGTYYPNIVTSNPQSLLRMAQGMTPTPQDPGYYIGKDQVLTPPPTSVARGQYINLTSSGRMAVPMAQKNLSEPILYVDELSGGSSPYDINDFYGLRASKKRTTDKATGNKYYRGVFD